MEKVDILKPPKFEKTGKIKTLEQAWDDEDWIGTFNLWILQESPNPSVIYQVRSPNSSWAPNKLDVTAGGHYEAGEELYDGLREVDEELGKKYAPKDITHLGQKMHVSPDVKNRMRKNLVDISFIIDNSSLDSYVLQASEVYAVCSCSVADLVKVHTEDYSFDVELLKSDVSKEMIKVTKDSFPFNWDNYHFKIALLAQRFLNKEKHLVY